jgi:putative membrane protein
MRIARARGVWGYYVPVDVAAAFSAMYEIVEWGVVKFSGNSKVGIDFLGAQGDIWDAQKDMGLAILGSVVAMLIVAFINWKYNPWFVAEIRESLKIEKGDRPLGEQRFKEWMDEKRRIIREKRKKNKKRIERE